MRRTWLICILLIVVTLLVYWPAFNCGFVNYDDTEYVTQNPHVQAGLTWDGLVWAFTTRTASNWHPLTWISHMVDCTLYGKNPGGPHATNLVFHIANAVLLFLVLMRLTRAPWRSGFVAALFALHPLHVESVAWVAERKDVLCTFFGLLAMLAYVRYTEKTSVVNYVWAILAFACGLMAKPMLVTLPLLLLLLDFWPLRRFPPTVRFWGRELPIPGGEHPSRWRRLLVEKLPFLALSLASCAMTLWAQGAVVGALRIPFRFRLANALIAYGAYIKKAVWPSKLVVLYPLPHTIAIWHLVIAVVALGVFTVFVIRHSRTHPYLFTGWFWYLIALLPVVGLVQAGFQSMADRYTYVPLIGLFIIVAWGGYEVATRYHLPSAAPAGLAILAIAACVPVTRVQLGYWQNSVTLFEHAVRCTTGNFIAENNLGVAYLNRGQLEEAGRHFAKAIQINPDDTDAHLSLAVTLLRQEKPAEAARQLAIVTRQTPNQWRPQAMLAIALMKQGKSAEALQHFSDAVRMNPSSAELRSQMAISLAQGGLTKEAVIQYRAALNLAPHRLEALNNLAWILATDPSPEIRNGREAVHLGEQACQLTGYRVPMLVGTLAAAYAEDGNFQKAVQMARKAESLALAAGNTNLAGRNKKLASLFSSQRPFRESRRNARPTPSTN